MKVVVWITAVVAALALGGVITLLLQKEKKTVFVYNQKVFDGFQGTKDLKEKLAKQEEKFRGVLDSMALAINAGRADLKPVYDRTLENLKLQQQQLSEKYTADIWSKINEESMNFGKENGYAFILGASGNGSLMYAGENVDVTGEFIAYLNRKYAGQK